MILPIIPKELKLYLSGVYGEAIGRYGSAQLPDATQAQSGENLPLKGSRLLAGITWDPDPQWTCYAYYGQEQLERKSWVDAATGKGYGYGSEPYDNSGASVLGARSMATCARCHRSPAGPGGSSIRGKWGRCRQDCNTPTPRTRISGSIKAGRPRPTTAWSTPACVTTGSNSRLRGGCTKFGVAAPLPGPAPLFPVKVIAAFTEEYVAGLPTYFEVSQGETDA
jgi:hypothetical protein